MEYTRPFQEFDDLADSLIERGMVCERSELITRLASADYYRLSGYWHIFREAEGKSFKPGTTLAEIWDIYCFDQQLRLNVFDAIGRVEVYMRGQLAHELAKLGGAFGYLIPANLPRLKKDAHSRFIKKCLTNVSRSREHFMNHFNEQYGDEHMLPPYWLLVNTMDFGMLLTLYKGAPAKVRNILAEKLGITSRVLESWLVALNAVRNICAHHNRLWNRTLGAKPMIPNKDMRWHHPIEIKSNKVFGILTILSYLLLILAPRDSWMDGIVDFLDEHLELSHRYMGFPSSWEACPFWRHSD